MKKLLFLVLLIFLTLGGVNTKAQIVKSIGLRTGLASTFPNIEETRNEQPVHDNIYNRSMIYGELQTEIIPHNQFSLLTNVAFISKGFNYPYTGSGGFGIIGSGGGVNHANADYFTLTAAPKLAWKLEKGSFYGFAGPYISFLNSYAAYYKQGLYFMGDFEEILVLKPRTWGGTIGAGIEFKRKSKAFYYSAQVQYMQDLTRAVDFTYSSTNSYGRNHNYLFQAKYQTLLLSFGIHYTFKKKTE